MSWHWQIHNELFRLFSYMVDPIGEFVMQNPTLSPYGKIIDDWFRAWHLELVDGIYDIFLYQHSQLPTRNPYAMFERHQLVSVILFPFVRAYIKIVLVSVTMLYILVYGYIGWINVKNGQFLFSINYHYLSEAEGEFGALEDYLAYVFGLVLLVAWFYFFTLFIHFLLLKHLQLVLAGWVIFILLTLLIPATTLANLGLAFSAYVRGAGKSQNVFAEVFLDFIAVSVIFIRFFIQNIRFVLIFLAFFELYEFIYLQVHFNLAIPFAQLITFTGWRNGYYTNMPVSNFVLNLIWSIILYFYYVIHLTLLYLVQFAIYTLLSFWLFCFLFTSFALTPAERHLFYKRYHNIDLG